MKFSTEAYEVTYEKETTLDLRKIVEKLHSIFKLNFVEDYVSTYSFLDSETCSMLKIEYTKKENMYYYNIVKIEEYETSELVYKKSNECKAPDCIVQYLNNYLKHHSKVLQKSVTTFLSSVIVETNENCEIDDVSEHYFKI